MSCNAAPENSIFEMRRVLNNAANAPRQSCFIVILSSAELPLASLWHIWPSSESPVLSMLTFEKARLADGVMVELHRSGASPDAKAAWEAVIGALFHAPHCTRFSAVDATLVAILSLHT